MAALARQSSADALGVLVSCVAARACPEIALMHLLRTVPSVERLRQTLAGLLDGETADLADAVRRLIDVDPEGVRRAAELLTDSGPRAGSAAERISAIASWFDGAVRKSEAASVAAYSFGSAERLERATQEVVSVFEAWGVLSARSSILQIGCGIGRFEAALAGRVHRAIGIDVSAGMIQVARRRCRAFANVRLELCRGRDLSAFADRSIDLVYAIDSFPYLYEADPSLVETHFREARRVLLPRAHLVIFNFSYRGDLDADRRDVARLAALTGFDVRRNGERPLCTWDGTGFHLRVAD